MHQRILAAALFASLAGASCAGTPPPPPSPVRLEAPPAKVVPPRSSARWVSSGGATLVGPETSRGTLVLLGGRRALVLAGGAMEVEETPAPEPLQDLVEVPTSAGPRLVGLGLHGVYRFDDPLGAPTTLARSDRTLARVGAGPGLVAVWAGSEQGPRLLDVQTGKDHAFAGLPELPLRALAFTDMTRGAGVFEAAGLAVTLDGGATWRTAKASRARDVVVVGGLRRRRGALRAFHDAEGPDAAVEIDSARLGPSEQVPEGPSAPALLRWIRANARDPLEAAVSGGVELPGGDALIAGQGMLARVDPKTGAVAQVVEIASGKWAPCSVARGRDAAAWMACALPDSSSDEMVDPFGVLRVSLDDPKLTPERPVLVRDGDLVLRVSPSGGAMLMGPCSVEEEGVACVRQPNGKWKTIAADVDLGDRGAGPLADGRLAFLRGVFDGDVASDASPGELGGDDASPRRLHVAVVGPDGREHALAPIVFTPSRGNVRAQSPIEEDTDRSLTLVIEDGEGPFTVTIAGGKGTPDVRKIAGAFEARLHGGRGIAVGEGQVLVSLDAGASWNETPAPSAALEAMRALVSSSDAATELAVSEIGARVGTTLRVGWGPPEGVSSPPVPEPSGLSLAALPEVDVGPPHTLRCTSAGRALGLPPVQSSSQIRTLLATKPRVKAGMRRTDNVWSSPRSWALDTAALFEEEAPDERAAPPARWTFRWLDPRELGGKPRSASVKVPAGATRGMSLRSAASDGARALFVLRGGGKHRLVRVRAAGAAETIEISQAMAPIAEVVFGKEKDEPIVWLRETQVIAWRAGDRPRVIAEVATHAPRALGVPVAEGVPLLVGADEWAATRVLPLAPAEAGSAPLSGWTRLPWGRRALGSLPACKGKPKGARFAVMGNKLSAEIDGLSERASSPLYEVRVAGTEACVERVFATLHAEPMPGSRASASGFARVDLVGKKAEGGERGVAPEATAVALKCALAKEQSR